MKGMPQKNKMKNNDEKSDEKSSTIDSTIIKIMRQKKELNILNLQGEALIHLKKINLIPVQGEIQKRIEFLINQGSLIRSDKDSKLILYKE
jgi:hypothetical protein